MAESMPIDSVAAGQLQNLDAQLDRSCTSKISRGIFGAAFVMVKDQGTQVSARTVFVLIALEMLQMASYPISLIHESTTLHTLNVALQSLATGAVERLVDAIDFTFILVIVMLVVSAFLGLTVVVAWRFVTDAPQSKGILRILRAMGQLFPTVFFLPMSNVLMDAFVCNPVSSTWMDTNMLCGGPGHIALATICGVILFLFTVTSLFVAATFLDKNPTTLSYAAKVHGRVDLLVILIKLFLVLLWKLPGAPADWTEGRRLAMAILLIVVGLTWLLAILYSLPNIRMSVNAAIVGSAAVFLWCGLGALIAQVPPRGGDPGLMIAFGALGVFAAAYQGLFWRISYLSSLPVAVMKGSLASLELWARLKLRVMLRSKSWRRFLRFRASGIGGTKGDTPLYTIMEEWRQRMTPRSGRADEARHLLGERDRGSDASFVSTGAASGRRRQGGPRGHRAGSVLRSGRPAELDTRDGREAIDDHRHVGFNLEMRNSHMDAGVGVSDEESASDDGSVAWRSDLQHPATGWQRHVDVEVALRSFSEALRVFESLPSTFPHSELACVMSASFWQAYSPYFYGELTALHQAATLSASLDTRFHVFRRIKEIRGRLQSEASSHGRVGAAQLTAIDRVMMDQRIKQIAQLRMASYRVTVKLWEVLSAKVVNLGDAAAAGGRLQDQLSQLETLYQQVLAADPFSTRMLRDYAAFLRQQQHSPDTVMELLNKADRIDESNMQRRGRIVQRVLFGMQHDGQLDESDDRAAFVVVSGSLLSLGEILQVTSGTCRLLGHRTPQQLIGLTIDNMVMAPVRAYHNRLMRRFRGQRRSKVIGSTRSLFVTTASGTLLPAWMRVSEAPPDDTTAAPRLTASFERIPTPEQHLVFGVEGDEFRIYGGTAGSLDLLGLSPEALKPEQEPLSASHFFPTLNRRMFDDHLQVTPTECSMTLLELADSPRRQSVDGRGRPPTNTAAMAAAAAAAAAAATRSAPDSARTSYTPQATALFRLLSHAAADSKKKAADDADAGWLVAGTTSYIKEMSPIRVVLSVEPLLLSTHNPMQDVLIPVNTTSRNQLNLVVGSVQLVTVSPSVRFHLLRWRSLESIRRRRHPRSQSMASIIPTQPDVVARQASSASSSLVGTGSGWPASSNLRLSPQAAESRQAQVLEPESPPSSPTVVAGVVGGVAEVTFAEGAPQEAGLQGTAAEPLGSVQEEEADESEGESLDQTDENGPGGTVQEAVAADGEHGAGDVTADANDSDEDRESSGQEPRVRLDHAAESESGTPAQQTRAASVSRSVSGQSDAARVAPTSILLRYAPAEPPKAAAMGTMGSRRFLQASPQAAMAHTSSPSVGPAPPRLALPLQGDAAAAVPMRRNPSMEPATGEFQGSMAMGDAGPSVGTSTTATSVSISTQFLSALKRQRTTPEPEVRRIQGVVLLVALACCAIGGANLWWVSNGNTRLRRHLSGLLLAEERSRLVEASTLHLYGLVGSSAGLSRAIFSSVEREAAELHASALELKALHGQLNSHGVGSDDDASLWERSRPWPMTEVSQAEQESHPRHSSRNASTPYGTGDPSQLDPLLAPPPCNDTGGCDPVALEFISFGSTTFWMTSDDINRFNSLNSAETVTTNHADFLRPSQVEAELEAQMAFMASSPAVADCFPMFLSQLGEYYAALMRRISLSPLHQLNYRNRDIRNGLGNDEIVREAVETSLDLRGSALIDVFPQLQLQLLITGTACFLLVASMQSWLLAYFISSLSRRTLSALRLLLLVPRHSCRHIRKTVSVRLERAIAEMGAGDEADGDPSNSDSDRQAASEKLLTTEKLTVKLRPHIDTSGFVTRHVCQYTAPTLLILVWLGTLVLYQVSQHERLGQLANRLMGVSLLARGSIAGYLHLYAVTFAADPSHRLQSASYVTRDTRRMVDLAEALVFGGRVEVPSTQAVISVHAVEGGSAVLGLMLEDGCSAASNQEACALLEDGALGDGVYTATQTIWTLARKLLAEVPPADEDPMAPLVFADSPGVFRTLARVAKLFPHFREALEQMVASSHEEMHSVLVSMWTFTLWVTLVFAVIFLVWAVLALLYVADLATPLHSARLLIALIPIRVRQSIPALMTAVRDMGTDPRMKVQHVVFDPSTTRFASNGGASGCCCNRNSDHGQLAADESDAEEKHHGGGGHHPDPSV